MMTQDRWTIRRLIWAIVGACALALGAVGAILPVLPTTPFVILAAFAFGKSVPSIQRWLEANRYFGPAIQDWNERGAIATRYKTAAVVAMLCVLVFSLLAGFGTVVILVQAMCMAIAAAYVLTRPSE